MNNWPQVAFFLAPVIALLGFILNSLYERSMILKVLKGELTQNAITFFHALPAVDVDQSEDALFDIANVVAVTAQSYVFQFQEAYRSKFHLLARRDMAQMKSAYRNFSIIRTESNHLLELLKIDDRNERQKTLVVRLCISILSNVITQKDLLFSLADKGFFSPVKRAHFEKVKGKAFQLHMDLKNAKETL